MSDSDELKQLRADLEVLERYYDDNYTGPNKAIRDLKSKIADLEAAADDPWRDAKQDVAYLVKSLEMRRVGELFDHLTAEVARLTARVAELEAAAKAEDAEDIADAEAVLSDQKTRYTNFDEATKAAWEKSMAFQPPFEGPIVGIDPVLNPDRVLATAAEYLKNPKWSWPQTQQRLSLIAGDAKPYPLKKGGA